MQTSLPLKIRSFTVRFFVPLALFAVGLRELGVAVSAIRTTPTPGRVAALLGGVFVASLLWRAWEGRRERRLLQSADERFIAAAENGLDSFFLFDAVRGADGEILDFRFRYVNSKGEEMLGVKREQLMGGLLCDIVPIPKDGTFFAECCRVVETGHFMDEEFVVESGKIKASWLRSRVVKLGDGIAVTAINLSQTKEDERRYEGIASFSDSIFESAPFSIIATDATGMITAMNAAAEKLSQYPREELIGKSSLAVLHDPVELQQRALEMSPETSAVIEGFAVLATKAAQGGVEEREWTYVRKDGTRAPVSLALRAIRSSGGKFSYPSISLS